MRCDGFGAYDDCAMPVFFFFNHKTAKEIRISDWSSDVCSSDLRRAAGARGAGDWRRSHRHGLARARLRRAPLRRQRRLPGFPCRDLSLRRALGVPAEGRVEILVTLRLGLVVQRLRQAEPALGALGPEMRRRPQVGRLVERARLHADQKRSEEHTSELQSLMRISYAVFCLKKKKTTT